VIDALLWLGAGLGNGFLNLFRALSNPMAWLDWSNREALGRFIYYGASKELFFAIFAALLVLTVIGLIRKPVMWAVVRGLEGFGNGLGRFAAWFGLIMVLQQVMIVFLQRIFRVNAIEFGPLSIFGYNLMPGTQLFGFDLQWWAEGLKFHNAVVIVLCVSYTFVQGGHVRVDLMYANVKFRTKRVIDGLGALLFMMPVAIITWIYAWFFMWRHLVTPNVAASERFEQVMRKANVMKWNVETIGPSPGGFNAYFLFKILIVMFALLVFVQAVAVLYRAILEWREGPESADRYRDRDILEQDAVQAH
jgi:TRAP-type mannitol/chloroaromatic compound transport system permease small subunit